MRLRARSDRRRQLCNSRTPKPASRAHACSEGSLPPARTIISSCTSSNCRPFCTWRARAISSDADRRGMRPTARMCRLSASQRPRGRFCGADIGGKGGKGQLTLKTETEEWAQLTHQANSADSIKTISSPDRRQALSPTALRRQADARQRALESPTSTPREARQMKPSNEIAKKQVTFTKKLDE